MMKARKQKKSILTFIGLLGLMMAAVLLLSACQSTEAPAAAQGSGGNGQRPNFQMQPAPELPTTQPTVRGLVASHNGTSLVVQLGNPNFPQGQGQGNGQRPTPNGTPRPRPTIAGAGTDVTVTVTADTVIYQDVTFANLNGQPPTRSVQQKVEKSSLDALSDNARVTVWGDQNGDQVTAKVIVYNQFRGGFQSQQQPQPQQQ